jgi:hypothetical protein
MAFLEKTARSASTAIAAVFIGLTLFGIAGVWWLHRRAAETSLKVFGLVETSVGVVDAGVARADDLLATSRTEVRQASEAITAVGNRAQAHTPVLKALNERLETRLAPRVAQIQQVLVLVRDAVAMIGNVVGLLNSLPFVADRAPRLSELDEAFTRLEGLSADTSQLHSTLRAMVTDQQSEFTPETMATLTGLTQRIDTRFGEVQAGVHGLRADIAALEVRLDARKTRWLLVSNLLALVAILMLAWILYSQVVVIRHNKR